MSDRDETDYSLVVQLSSGDATALRSIMERYVDRLRIIAEIITHAPDLAGEAVQETFIQLWGRREGVDPHGNLSGLLIVMTRNNALKLLRHERVHERMSAGLQSIHDATGESGLNDGARSIDRRELWELIRAVLDDLPPRCREIFLLHWEAGLSYAEIEQALEISNATIRNQMSRAMKHLTTVVGPERFSLWWDRS